jgi:hypothetical protein
MVQLEYHYGEEKAASRLNAMTMRVGPIGGGGVVSRLLEESYSSPSW